MTQELGYLPPTWESLREFWPPGYRPALDVSSTWGVNQQMEMFSLSFYLPLPFKKIRTNKNVKSNRQHQKFSIILLSEKLSIKINTKVPNENFLPLHTNKHW